MSTIIEDYLLEESIKDDDQNRILNNGKTGIFQNWILENGVSENAMNTREECSMIFPFTTISPLKNVDLGLVLRDTKGEIIFSCCSRDNGGEYFNLNEGDHEFNFKFRFPAKQGHYEVDIILVSNGKVIDHFVSKKKLQVLSKYESYLDDKWSGIISELPYFKHIKDGYREKYKKLTS
jgi:hypothetical protein